MPSFALRSASILARISTLIRPRMPPPSQARIFLGPGDCIRSSTVALISSPRPLRLSPASRVLPRGARVDPLDAPGPPPDIVVHVRRPARSVAGAAVPETDEAHLVHAAGEGRVEQPQVA